MKPTDLPPLDRAAIYVRASTEHQDYSTEHQEAALREYAQSHQMEIISRYSDEGRSGLRLAGREGLLQLLTDVERGRVEFRYVLVYDVSRWGRFQDVDESAYYEFACRRAGISVCYCAEPFENDGSPLATILKGLKRAMAAEYSRDLSAKVFRAQCRLTTAGYKQGGTAGYGLRRMSIAADGTPRRLLEFKDRKGAPTDRVTYVPGPPNEVALVHRIYSMFIEERMKMAHIANRLNSEGNVNEFGRPWSAHTVPVGQANSPTSGRGKFPHP